MFGAQHLLATYGVVGIGVILFLETGCCSACCCPGETLAILAGAFSHVHHAASRIPRWRSSSCAPGPARRWAGSSDI